jgi:hypothetical protein
MYLQAPQHNHRRELDHEWESDLELSQGESDDDWSEVQEMRAARKTCAVPGGCQAVHKVKRKSSSSSGGKGLSKKPLRELDSLENQANPNAAAMGPPSEVTKNNLSEPHSAPLNSQCCSCSQIPVCKTEECACKAVGALCRPECQCKFERCENRGEAHLGLLSQGDVVPFERSPPMRQGVERRLSLVGILDEVEAGARRAERAMVAQAAALLETACKEVIMNIDERQQQEDLAPEGGPKLHPRRPLSDLGNIQVHLQYLSAPLFFFTICDCRQISVCNDFLVVLT